MAGVTVAAAVAAIGADCAAYEASLIHWRDMTCARSAQALARAVSGGWKCSNCSPPCPVALMGRSHPVGVLLAAILFGFLYQGGAELALWTSIPREMIVVIQALVILFTGALDNMVRMPLERLFLTLRKREG